MNDSKRYAICICDDLDKDHVGPRVLEALLRRAEPTPTHLRVDGRPVLRTEPLHGVEYLIARTADVLSHDYEYCLPQLAGVLDAVSAVAVVNWHEGASAPDDIFCVHTTAEVADGFFPPADPVFTGAMLRSIEAARRARGLERFQTLTEGTHWSGTQYASPASRVMDCLVPVIDVEIGSAPGAWSDPEAADVLAEGVLGVGASLRPDLPVVLYVGGIHFERSMSEVVLGDRPPFDVDPAHILPNQWVAHAGYEGPEGVGRLVRCARSVRGGVHALAFHDKLQGSVKASVRGAAEQLGVPCHNHKQMRKVGLSGLCARVGKVGG